MFSCSVFKYPVFVLSLAELYLITTLLYAQYAVLTECEDMGFEKPLSSHSMSTGYCSYNNKVMHRREV
jgi:hypothetical protein